MQEKCSLKMPYRRSIDEVKRFLFSIYWQSNLEFVFQAKNQFVNWKFHDGRLISPSIVLGRAIALRSDISWNDFCLYVSPKRSSLRESEQRRVIRGARNTLKLLSKEMLFVLLVLAGAQLSAGQFEPNCDGKQVIVQLFEWKWTDVAAECERFLATAGYCAVQVRNEGRETEQLRTGWLKKKNKIW